MSFLALLIMQKPDLSIFPLEPGVYLFKDSTGKILYVGKARKLRNRLASYFRDASSLTPKTHLMIQNAHTVDILRTGTEKEALLLEASLIKKHRPRYNIVLRDDKEYLLFRVGGSHPFPKVELVRRSQRRTADRGERWYGPFSSALAARETWRLIHKHFPLRRCRDITFTNRTRPCLYHDMGQCLGPCVLPVTKEEYRAVMDKVSLILSGKSKELAESLQEDMCRASEEMRFEDAAMLRDQLQAVQRTLERQSVVLSEKRTLDLVAVAQVPEGLALGVVFVREGQLLDGRNFFWPGLSVEDTPELLSGFLAQFYLDRKGLGESIPPRVVVPWLPGQEREEGPQIIMESLCEPHLQPAEDCDLPAIHEYTTFETLEMALSEIRGGQVHITRPKNQDEDNLLLMAATNARDALKNSIHSSMGELLAKRLRSAKPVRRIEVVDISHTGGVNTRAGMVVFEDEQPIKQDYRTYSLDATMQEAGAEAGDDYAALAAWAKRRAVRGAWPDMILIDGGKGQLAAVHRAFSELGISIGNGQEDSFILASIAKARDDDGKADRRAGNINDRIFLPGRSNPLPLNAGSPELLFLQRIRDAAHDYVIGRHRKARAAATLSGELTRIPGVGPKMARRLFETFGSLGVMAEAGEEALAQLPGIGKARARAIADRLALLVKKETE